MVSPCACVQASSVRAPALLECVAAMAASPALAPVLAGHRSVSHAAIETTVASVAGDRQAEGADEGAAQEVANMQLGHK